MRIALVDDSALFRGGLKLLLEETDQTAQVTEHRTGADLMHAVSHQPVDAAIIDVRMPPTYTDEGITVAQDLRHTHPGIGILVLSTYAEISYAAQLLELPSDQAGTGYLLKDHVSDIALLHDALRRVCAGEPLVDPGIAARLLKSRRKLDGLTPQERNVLQAMAEGHSNAGISTELHLSVRTVEDYCARIFDKLGIDAASNTNRRVNAVLEYLRNQT